MSDESTQAEAQTRRLLEIMAKLRDPEHGCPWDIEQDFRSIAPYTIEEAYEVAAAIEPGDMGELRDELGDLLLQVVFHARMAEEAGAFDFAQVATRSPTRCCAATRTSSARPRSGGAAAQTRAWEEHKARGTGRQRRGRRASSAASRSPCPP